MNRRYTHCLYCFGCRVMSDAGVIVEVQGSLLGMRVTAGAGVAESALSDHQESSSSEEGQDPRVAGGDLLGVVFPGARSEVSSMAFDRSSCSSAVMLVAGLAGILHGGMHRWRKVALRTWGTEVMGALSLDFTLERLTCRSDGLQTGMPGASIFQKGGSEKVNCMGSNPPIQAFGAYHLVPTL